jgi:acyl-CoA reductase-like NAD-dependent aldehyde dehydrogenase
LATGELIEVRNPRNGEIDFRFNAPSAAELATTLDRLRSAQRTWAARSLAERIEILRRWRGEWVARQAEIARALSIDTGRYLIATSEVQSVTGMIDRWTNLVPTLAVEEELRSPTLPTISYRSQYVPYGLVFHRRRTRIARRLRRVRQAERSHAAFRRACDAVDCGGAGASRGVSHPAGRSCHR